MKNYSCLFERLFKEKGDKMVFSFLEYLFFIFEILTFLYYANYESDDVMRFATQMVKY